MLFAFLDKKNVQSSKKQETTVFKDGSAKKGEKGQTRSPPGSPSAEWATDVMGGPESNPCNFSSTGNGMREDVLEDAARKVQRDSELWRLIVTVCLCVCASWMLGWFGASIAWLLLIILLIGVLGRGSLSRLLQAALAIEVMRLRRRRAIRHEETAEWLNFLINRWWVFSSASIFTLVKSTLEPLLNASKPSILESLELRQFTLGNDTPIIKCVKVFDVSNRPIGIASPPPGLSQSVSHQVALEAEADLHSEDFRMVLRGRLGGKSVGMDMDVAIEKLHISGKLYITLDLNMDAPFPHISRVTLSFLERPEVWFSISILKAVQMMEVPVLKTWIHTLVLDAFTTALVDPGHLDINLCAVECMVPEQQTGRDIQAQGVLTISFRIATIGKKNTDVSLPEDVRWLVLQLGSQKLTSSCITATNWQECRSFLVTSLQDDCLFVKVKNKRFISAVTAAQFEIPLASYNLECGKVYMFMSPCEIWLLLTFNGSYKTYVLL